MKIVEVEYRDGKFITRDRYLVKEDNSHHVSVMDCKGLGGKQVSLTELLRTNKYAFVCDLFDRSNDSDDSQLNNFTSNIYEAIFNIDIKRGVATYCMPSKTLKEGYNPFISSSVISIIEVVRMLDREAPDVVEFGNGLREAIGREAYYRDYLMLSEFSESRSIIAEPNMRVDNMMVSNSSGELIYDPNSSENWDCRDLREYSSILRDLILNYCSFTNNLIVRELPKEQIQLIINASDDRATITIEGFNSGIDACNIITDRIQEDYSSLSLVIESIPDIYFRGDASITFLYWLFTKNRDPRVRAMLKYVYYESKFANGDYSIIPALELIDFVNKWISEAERMRLKVKYEELSKGNKSHELIRYLTVRSAFWIDKFITITSYRLGKNSIEVNK